CWVSDRPHLRGQSQEASHGRLLRRLTFACPESISIPIQSDRDTQRRMWRRGEGGGKRAPRRRTIRFPKRSLPIRRGKCACQALARTGACVQPIMKGIHLVFELGVLFSLRPFRCGLAEKTFGRAQN